MYISLIFSPNFIRFKRSKPKKDLPPKLPTCIVKLMAQRMRQPTIALEQRFLDVFSFSLALLCADIVECNALNGNNVSVYVDRPNTKYNPNTAMIRTYHPGEQTKVMLKVDMKYRQCMQFLVASVIASFADSLFAHIEWFVQS